MTWEAFHRRTEVLRAVAAEAERRGDGTLPMHVAGVLETFGDEAGLVAALQLRWHTRLTGSIERELAEDASDPARAVVAGWRRSAVDAAGIRAVLDAQAAAPATDAVRELLARALRKEHAMLAALAAQAAPGEAVAVVLGERLEQEARAGLPAAPAGAHRARDQAQGHRAVGASRIRRGGSLMARLRARLAA